MIEFFTIEKNLIARTLNLYDVYGLDDWRGKIFNRLLLSFQEHTPLSLTSGKEYMNLVSIDDIVEAFRITLEEILERDPFYESLGKNRLFAIAGDEIIDLKSLVALMEKVFNKKSQVNWDVFPEPKDRPLGKPIIIGEKLPYWKKKYNLRSYLIENYKNIIT